jgi:hypothetical protein
MIDRNVHVVLHRRQINVGCGKEGERSNPFANRPLGSEEEQGGADRR